MSNIAGTMFMLLFFHRKPEILAALLLVSSTLVNNNFVQGNGTVGLDYIGSGQ
jgi:hypothetical protein